jgi:uncharacterized protein YndB with AHSA1/START domain
MSKPAFVYTTYIETSAEKLWHALTDGDFTERYWFGYRLSLEPKAGSPYTFTRPDGTSVDGKVLEFDPPRRLAYTWNLCSPEAAQEPVSRVAFDLETRGKVVKLTVTHDAFGEGSKTQRDISGGWPMVLASLKSLLETGHPLIIDPPSSAMKEKTDAQA